MHLLGFTVPEVDSVLLPYAEKSYNNFYQEKLNIEMEMISELEKDENLNLSDEKINELKEKAKKRAKEYAFKKTHRECEQGMQGIEYKLNTVGSSRGEIAVLS